MAAAAHGDRARNRARIIYIYIAQLGPSRTKSPGEIKGREVGWTLKKKLAQKGSRAGRWCWAIETLASVVSQRRSYGHCLCDSVLHSSWDSNVVAAQCRTDTALTSCCSGGGPRQPWSSGLAPVSRFHSSIPLSHRPRP